MTGGQAEAAAALRRFKLCKHRLHGTRPGEPEQLRGKRPGARDAMPRTAACACPMPAWRTAGCSTRLGCTCRGAVGRRQVADWETKMCPECIGGPNRSAGPKLAGMSRRPQPAPQQATHPPHLFRLSCLPHWSHTAADFLMRCSWGAAAASAASSSAVQR